MPTNPKPIRTPTDPAYRCESVRCAFSADRYYEVCPECGGGPVTFVTVGEEGPQTVYSPDFAEMVAKRERLNEAKEQERHWHRAAYRAERDFDRHRAEFVAVRR